MCRHCVPQVDTACQLHTLPACCRCEVPIIGNKPRGPLLPKTVCYHRLPMHTRRQFVVCRHCLPQVDTACQLQTLPACCRCEVPIIGTKPRGPLPPKTVCYHRLPMHTRRRFVVCRHCVPQVDTACQLQTLPACCRREVPIIGNRARGPLPPKTVCYHRLPMHTRRRFVVCRHCVPQVDTACQLQTLPACCILEVPMFGKAKKKGLLSSFTCAYEKAVRSV